MNKTITSLLLAGLLLGGCSGNIFTDNYYRSQVSPTAVGQTVEVPVLENCGEMQADVLYRVYTGKGYDPIGYSVFVYDRSVQRDCEELLMEQARNVYADLVTYTIRHVETMHDKEPHATPMYEYRAVYWQKSTYSPHLGGECRMLTDGEMSEFGIDGILVTAIRRERPGFKGDVRVGDIITAVDGRPMPTLKIFRETVEQSIGKRVRLDIYRAGQTLQTYVELEGER